MNKRITSGICVVVILTLCMCIYYLSFGKSSGLMVCTMNSTSYNVNFNTRYEVKYEKRIVTYVTSKEIISSSDESILDNYKMYLENMYTNYKKLDYYNNKVVINDDKLISTTSIDYKKIDTDKLIDIDRSNSAIIEEGKVYLKRIKRQYENIGASCKMK